MIRSLYAAALLAPTLLAAASPAIAQSGADLFKQRCQVCHVAKAGARPTIGPNLAGVMGRKAGSTAYPYSAALKKSGLVWDKATLDRFLAGPGKAVPGTRMNLAVPDAKQRAAIVAHLATVK
ncbi:c-type cytochrome [Sphingomonas sp. TX0543]|uniref:c-type cytochrome n=1 Tax=unclassified Sphingomonas TaxID=196159 RepID=UPI0020162646|nr:c-type cytochrome [Sphingomonas sp. 3P27F8]